MQNELLVALWVMNANICSFGGNDWWWQVSVLYQLFVCKAAFYQALQARLCCVSNVWACVWIVSTPLRPTIQVCDCVLSAGFCVQVSPCVHLYLLVWKWGHIRECYEGNSVSHGMWVNWILAWCLCPAMNFSTFYAYTCFTICNFLYKRNQ